MKHILVFLALMVLTAACATPLVTPPAGQSDGDAAETIVREYTGWTRMFDEARSIAMNLMVMCRLLTEQEQAFVNSEHGQAYVQVYANPVGAPAMQLRGSRAFPEGSVIVKEKFEMQEYLTENRTGVKPTGLGIMVKREKGYSEQARDWEYLYVDQAGAIHRDQKQLEQCIACHNGIQERDSIFYPEAPGQF